MEVLSLVWSLIEDEKADLQRVAHELCKLGWEDFNYHPKRKEWYCRKKTLDENDTVYHVWIYAHEGHLYAYGQAIYSFSSESGGLDQIDQQPRDLPDLNDSDPARLAAKIDDTYPHLTPPAQQDPIKPEPEYDPSDL